MLRGEPSLGAHVPRVQYLAGIGKYSYEMEEIYREFDAVRKFPDSLFVAGQEWKEQLRQALDNAPAPRGHFH